MNPGRAGSTLAVKPEKVEVLHFIVRQGEAHLRPHPDSASLEMCRPVHQKLRPADGWKFVTMEFSSENLQAAVDRYQAGFEHAGRCYFFASSSNLSCRLETELEFPSKFRMDRNNHQRESQLSQLFFALRSTFIFSGPLLLLMGILEDVSDEPDDRVGSQI